jgi:hypothetical protein
MARVRSPNYPSISLPDAIERVRKVYDREHTHKAAPEVIAKALGYAGVNGSSLGVMSALKKYGLLEDVGKDWKVSTDALTILVDPPHSVERAHAIRRAAQAPALFANLLEEYGEKPPSDDNLRAYLLKRGFAQSAVDTPMRAYRETLEFVSKLPDAYNAPMERAIQTSHGGHVARPGAGAVTMGGMPSATTETKRKLLTVLFDGTLVEVQATLESQVAAKQLIRVIEANMPLLPEQPAPDAITDQKEAD